LVYCRKKKGKRSIFYLFFPYSFYNVKIKKKETEKRGRREEVVFKRCVVRAVKEEEKEERGEET